MRLTNTSAIYVSEKIHAPVPQTRDKHLASQIACVLTNRCCQLQDAPPRIRRVQRDRIHESVHFWIAHQLAPIAAKAPAASTWAHAAVPK